MAFSIIAIIVMTAIAVLLIWSEIRSHRSKISKQIDAEKKAVREYQKEFARIDTGGPNVRELEKIRIGKSDKAKCPYCGRTFLVSSGTCPSCGATVSITEDEITITRSNEHIEVLKGMEYRHKEKLEELKAKRSKARRENTTIFLFMLVLVIAIVIIVWIVTK